METRRQPSRRVREEASVKKDVENAEKEASKRSKDEEGGKALKKQKKTKAEDNNASEASNSKKNVKDSTNAKAEQASPAGVEANGDTKKKASKAGKAKTDEALDVKPTEDENQDARRSKSVEPTTTANKTKKKQSKKEEVVAKEPVAAKKGDKKAADKVEVAQDAPKANGRAKRGSPSAESPTDVPPVKKGRGKKVESNESQTEEESTSPAKADESGSNGKEKSPKGDKKLQNSVDTNYSDIDFGIKEKFNFKITTWNVAGLRALANKNPDYFTQENADVICMNEIKCGSFKDIPDKYKLEGYHAYWNLGKGAGGVALLSKIEPKEVVFDLPDSAFSDEKRMITAEFEKFFVISVYVVNAGRGLKTLEKRLEWNEVFDAYVKELDKKKPVIIAGDMNVSHQEIDLANPKTNKKNAGFTPEERDGFDKLLSLGFVDSFRHFYPDLTDAYTYWTYMSNARARNVGWRLDYFLVSERLMKHVKDNVIRSSVLGSDHCPIVLFLNL